MNKIVVLLILELVVVGGFGVGAFQDNNSDTTKTMREHFTVNYPIFIDDGDSLSIHLDETEIYIRESGKPMLPVLSKVYTYPLGTQIIDISFDIERDEYLLGKKIQLCPPPSLYARNCYLSPNDFTFIDKEIYSSSTFYPTTPYIIKKGAGLQDDELVLFLNIRIIPQYLPAHDLLYIPREVEICIEYIPPHGSFINGDEYDMVIIAPAEFSSCLQPLIDHKNSYGLKPFLKTTEEIYKDFSGRDNAEKIKYFVKDSIETYGIRYVLLVGDIDLVPMRKSRIDCELIHQEGILTDLYYADIYDSNGSFCSWDSNHNMLFGEYKWDVNINKEEYIDVVDLYPDVGVGRLPCKNEQEIAIMSDKIITYETETYGKDWFNRLILMGGNCDRSFSDLYEGEWKTEMTGKEMEKHGFNSVDLWTSLDSFYPSLINEEISQGAGFVVYTGHGDERGLSTYTPDDEKIGYEKQHLLNLRNNYRLPIIYLDACLTGNLEFSILYFFKSIPRLYWILTEFRLITNIKFPCFAWSIVKKPSGGGIASICASQPAYDSLRRRLTGNYSDYLRGTALLHKTFFENYDPGIILSDMLSKAKIEYLNSAPYSRIYQSDPITVEEYNLIGDPSLKIGGYP